MNRRLTLRARYLIETGRVVSDIVSGVYTVDASVARHEMIALLADDLRDRVTQAGHRIVGEIDIEKFIVEDA